LPRRIEAITTNLSLRFRQTVIDQTDLNGEYLMNLEDLSATFRQQTPPAAGEEGGNRPADAASEPAAETFRLLEKWGLKLNRARLPFSVVVVDSVEKVPSEN
jgi:uncharacterized protein (TIGR03435 family)